MTWIDLVPFGLVCWYSDRKLARAIANREIYGDYMTVPIGYEHRIIQAAVAQRP